MNWKDQIAVIVGAGPSASAMPLELARGVARVIAINESWRLVPWADILYATDGIWWIDNKGVPEFEGRRFTSSPHAMTELGIDLFMAQGATSGTRALYLAERLQANPVLLVGFEMHCDNGVHWHPPHNGRLRNPGPKEMAIWRADLERVAPGFAERGMRIINCTPTSALTCFPYVNLIEALNGGHC